MKSVWLPQIMRLCAEVKSSQLCVIRDNQHTISAYCVYLVFMWLTQNKLELYLSYIYRNQETSCLGRCVVRRMRKVTQRVNSITTVDSITDTIFVFSSRMLYVAKDVLEAIEKSKREEKGIYSVSAVQPKWWSWEHLS